MEGGRWKIAGETNPSASPNRHGFFFRFRSSSCIQSYSFHLLPLSAASVGARAPSPAPALIRRQAPHQTVRPRQPALAGVQKFVPLLIAHMSHPKLQNYTFFVDFYSTFKHGFAVI
jgi:hypothetical protein